MPPCSVGKGENALLMPTWVTRSKQAQLQATCTREPLLLMNGMFAAAANAVLDGSPCWPSPPSSSS